MDVRIRAAQDVTSLPWAAVKDPLICPDDVDVIPLF